MVRGEVLGAVKPAAPTRHGRTGYRALGGYGALVAGAWLALVVIRTSPYRDFVGHRVLGENAISPPAAVGLFAVGWLLMLVAMMVPGALPGMRTEGWRVNGSVRAWLAGALAPWLLFGFMFAAADLVMHAVIAPRFPLFALRLPALTWLGAGAYELALWARSAPVTASSHAKGGAVHGAFQRGWERGGACVRDGWLMMLAVAGSHDQLVAMAAVTIGMSAPSYVTTRFPRLRWIRAATGTALAFVGARLLVLAP
ncbi:MAG TPA: DUF2182 domain-containing protein [Trueperaceae bacterium]|nr:DUF2182 domain-containing protein [Trueperaceae bacterium]